MLGSLMSLIRKGRECNMKKQKNYDLEIFAGPCSITPENAEEIINITSKIITPAGSRAIYGTRVVGLKSRTSMDLNGQGMGIDSQVIQHAHRLKTEDRQGLKVPSVQLAERIVKDTGMAIATEVMIPHIQLPYWEEKEALKGKVMIWNPSVNQLGWNIYEMSEFARRNDWSLGIKHGKFLGKDSLEIANHQDYIGETSLEKVLLGLTTYAQNITSDLVIIHRGVDVPGRGEYRNAQVHEVMKRIKMNAPHAKIYFDPTHSIGPQMRHVIFDEALDAMKTKVDATFLYDGLLVEAASTSPVDIGEHLTLEELSLLVNELHAFRKIRTPGK